tara:strand:- start:2907 stop:3122 length:216 start_codon:yes stop_codon:yes gene_type:complete
MFRTNFLIVDEEWNLITQYKSRVKPDVGEFIYLEPRYFKVINVIHTFKILPNAKNVTVIVKEWGNIGEKFK